MPAENRGNSKIKKIYYRKQFTGNTNSLTDCNSQGQFPLIFDTFSCWLKYHRVTKWGSKYFTHEKSYYPVPRTSMEFANVNFMQRLPPKVIRPEIETAIKELVEKYRPVRQGTVRGETSKDKAGALPPAVNTHNTISIKRT